jgi:hypothetical protein
LGKNFQFRGIRNSGIFFPTGILSAGKVKNKNKKNNNQGRTIKFRKSSPSGFIKQNFFCKGRIEQYCETGTAGTVTFALAELVPECITVPVPEPYLDLDPI